MPVHDLMLEGLKLMVLGMGIVFVFLVLLVLAMRGMSGMARMLERNRLVASPATRTPSLSTTLVEEQELVSVIAGAIRHYRATHH